LPNEAMAEFLKMGTIVVELLNAGAIGDNVEFDQATGELYAIAGTTPTVGRTLVPNTKVVRQNVPAAGLAFIQLTN